MSEANVPCIVGVLAALPGELASFTQSRKPNNDIVQVASNAMALCCGMGPVRAMASAERLLQAGATALVSWGSAGALVRGAEAGHLMLPPWVCAAADRHEPWQVNADWHRHVRRVFTDAATKGAVQVSEVADPSTKRTLAAHYGADMVDMESAAIAAVAASRGIPLLIVRSICDGVDAGIPEAARSAIDAQGRLRPFGFLRAIVKRPGEIGDLIAVSKGFRAACATLSRVRDALGPDLGCNASFVGQKEPGC